MSNASAFPSARCANTKKMRMTCAWLPVSAGGRVSLALLFLMADESSSPEARVFDREAPGLLQCRGSKHL